jgi:putative lipoprotein
MRGVYLVIFTAVFLGAACTPEENASEPQSKRAGDSHTGGPGRPGQTYVYECEDGTQFTARVEGDKAWLFLRSGTLSLPHVEAASGAKFSDGMTTYWSKGESAMLERRDHARTACSNNRRAAIWEDAKLRGADFRAVGNEPGWNLEISRGNGIYFVTNYGSDKYTFAMPEPVSDKKAGTTSYSASTDGHKLSILLERGPCMDTMSDEQFETKVTVKFDEATLHGCGRPLH